MTPRESPRMDYKRHLTCAAITIRDKRQRYRKLQNWRSSPSRQASSTVHHNESSCLRGFRYYCSAVIGLGAVRCVRGSTRSCTRRASHNSLLSTRSALLFRPAYRTLALCAQHNSPKSCLEKEGCTSSWLFGFLFERYFIKEREAGSIPQVRLLHGCPPPPPRRHTNVKEEEGTVALTRRFYANFLEVETRLPQTSCASAHSVRVRACWTCSR